MSTAELKTAELDTRDESRPSQVVYRPPSSRPPDAAFSRENVAGAVRPALANTDASEILGTSLAMCEVRDLVDRVAPTDSTVLLRGETGTGKSLIARSIHDRSSRRNGPFVACAPAALPDGLIESELFGYARGAFNGALQRKPGRVELAEGGTLFLDEIGDLSSAMQVKLLGLLEEREYTPLGATRTYRADVRFVAATHRNLEEMVGEGSFREDLYFRLNVVDIWVPPLRERVEDIPAIARSKAARVAARDKRPFTLDDSAVACLCERAWPGNVRELVNFVQRLALLSKKERITAHDVRKVTTRPSACPAPPSRLSNTETGSRHLMPVTSLAEALERAERDALVNAVAFAGGNRVQAARLLGIGRTALYQKLERHELHQRRRVRAG